MNNSLISLSDKVALVTGAASGIGRASAVMLASVGAKVVVCDLNEAEGKKTVELIKEADGEGIFIKANIANAASVEALVSAIVEKYGRLDCAHNNAGIESPLATIADSQEDAWDKSIAVNLKGPWLCMRAEVRQMLRQGGGGAIVNTASVGGLTGIPMNASYSAAKHGVIGLTKSVALEYATQNIRVNAICPGLTRTGMTDRLASESQDIIKSIMPPIQRFAEPAEMAGMVAFLFSPLASYLTGQAIAIDGAATAA